MCADITLARDLLAYSPSMPLLDGLRQTLTLDPRFAVKPSPV